MKVLDRFSSMNSPTDVAVRSREIVSRALPCGASVLTLSADDNEDRDHCRDDQDRVSCRLVWIGALRDELLPKATLHLI